MEDCFSTIFGECTSVQKLAHKNAGDDDINTRNWEDQPWKFMLAD